MPKRHHDADDDDLFDERGFLKDKHSVRVPMMMRDSADGLTDLQRSVRDATAPLRVVDAFGNCGLALNMTKPSARPGKATTQTTAKSRAFTIPAILSPTLGSISSTICRTVGQSAAAEGDDHERALS